MESMTRLIHTLEPHVDGLIPCLSSGEGKELTASEWLSVIQAVCAVTSKPVYAGILSSSEKEIMERIQQAELLPCAGVVIPTIYDAAADTVEFIRRIHESTLKDIVVYNTEHHPITSIEALQSMDALERVIGVKDSTMDREFFKQCVAMREEGSLQMSVFQGMEHLLLESEGCDGFILSLLNVEPELCAEMLKNPNPELNTQFIAKFWELNLGAGWFITLKAVLHMRGVIRSAEQVRPAIRPL